MENVSNTNQKKLQKLIADILPDKKDVSIVKYLSNGMGFVVLVATVGYVFLPRIK